jgi:hypothetical protein
MRINTLIKQINNDINSKDEFIFTNDKKSQLVMPFFDTTKLKDRKILNLKLEHIYYLLEPHESKKWNEFDLEKIPSVETLILSLPDVRELDLSYILYIFKNLKHIIISEAPNLIKIYFKYGFKDLGLHYERFGATLESFIILDDSNDNFRGKIFYDLIDCKQFLENLKYLKLSSDVSVSVENDNKRNSFIQILKK